MIISIIVAMDKLRGIGFKGKIPWRLSTDLKRFKSYTMGHHIVMGRKTYESIGRPLPGRVNIIMSHQESYHPEGCIVVSSFSNAVKLADNAGEVNLFVIGGAEIYRLALPQTDMLYLTEVQAGLQADAFFPELVEDDWIELKKEVTAADKQNQYSSIFRILERKEKI